MQKTKEEIAAEAYQVIGSLAGTAGLFDHKEVQRALDYFSEHSRKTKSRADILPFVVAEAK